MNPGLPILDASYNKKQNSKGAPTPTPGSSTASGLPVLDATFNSQFKKKVGGENYGTQSPTESVSESVSVSTEPTNPTSFLKNDIDEAFRFSDSQPQFTFESLAQPTMPDANGATAALDKEKKKQAILSEPNELRDYRKNRVGTLKNDISRLNEELQKYRQPNLYLAGSPGAQLSNEVKYNEGAQPIIDEIAAKKKYLEQLESNIQNRAAYAVVSKEDLSNVTDVQLKSIGQSAIVTGKIGRAHV